VEPFLSNHAHAVTGTLSGFDRLVFRGTSRLLANCAGMMRCLWAVRTLLKDFASQAEAMTRRLRQAPEALARRTGRPLRYLASSAANKEEIAHEIARSAFGQRELTPPNADRTDNIEQGLICILEAVEPCLPYQISRHRESRHLLLRPSQRKCLHFYHYQIHPVFGFMHARIRSWFPFTVQICLNGREWLARPMDTAGLGHVRRDNCVTWLEDPAQTRQLMDQQVRAVWPDLLDGIARSLNPAHAAMFQACPIQYYWSTCQSGWATGIMFRDARAPAGLYPKLVHHAMTTFASPDVLRCLGRTVPPTGNIPSWLQAEVASGLKRRPEGARIKHRAGANSVKMHDTSGPKG
jgi:hypothetical protein